MKPRIDYLAAYPQPDPPTITAKTDPLPTQPPVQVPARIHLMLNTKTTKAFSSEMDSTSSEEPHSPMYLSDRSNEGNSPRGSMEDGLEEPGSSQGCKYSKAYKKVQERIEHVMRESTKHTDFNPQKVLLYVIKMTATKMSRTPTLNMQGGGDPSKNKHQLFEYFKMYLDCSKCQEDGRNDLDLRRFRRKVKKKLRLGENFRIYNQQGHPIQDCDLSFINQENRRRGIVYVSQQNVMFDYEVYLRMFKEVRKLGEGGYGQVFLGRHMITSEEHAIKFIQPNISKADEASKAFKEAQVLQTLKHSSVIKLRNVFQLPDTRIILFMQFIKGGSLKDYIDQQPGRKVLENEAQKIMYEVSCALNYCHQRRIVHRDIKLENIMMRERGSISRGVIIIDFGLAGNLQKMKEYHLEGTIKYAPPELMSGSNLHADPAFDVWTLGVLMYRLVSGIYPFEGNTFAEVKKSILTHNPDFPIENFEFISDSCVALIKLMLNKDSTKRPKLYQLIQHPWFMPHKQYQLISSNPTMTMDNTLMHFFKQELTNTQALRNNSSTGHQDPTTSQGQANMTTNESMTYYLSRRKGFGSKKSLHYGVKTKDLRRDHETNGIKKTRQGQMVQGVGFGAQSGTNVMVQEQVGLITSQAGKGGSSVNANIALGWNQQNDPQSNSKMHKNVQPSSPFKEAGAVLDQNPINRIVRQLGTLEKVPSKLKSNQKRWESNQRRNQHLQALLENHFGLANHAKSPDKVLLIQQMQGDDESLTPRSHFSMSSYQQKQQTSIQKGKGLNAISELKAHKLKISKPELPLINNAGAKGKVGQVVEIQTFDIEEGNQSPKRRSNIQTVNHTSNNSILPETTRGAGAENSSNFKVHPSLAGNQTPIDNYDQMLLTRGGGSLSRYGFDAITPQLVVGGQFTTKNQNLIQKKQRKSNLTQLDESRMDQMMHSNSSPKVSFGNPKSALKQQNSHTKVAGEKRVVINLV